MGREEPQYFRDPLRLFGQTLMREYRFPPQGTSASACEIVSFGVTMDANDITFHELQLFLEFSRTEHLGQAAEALGTSVPSIQRAVRALETQLGVQLVEREGRRIRLLHAGRVLAEQAAGVIRARADALDTVRATASHRAMTLRLGHMFSVGLTVVPRLIAKLYKMEPAARVLLRPGRTNALVASVLSGENDAAFVSPCPLEPDLASIALFTESVVLAVAADGPLATRSFVDLSELREHPFVSLPEGSGSRYDLMQACARAGFVPKVTIEVGDMYTVEGAVGAGLGVAVVPESMRGVPHPKVVHLPLREVVPTVRTVGLVYPRNAKQHGAFAALLRLAKEEGERENPAAELIRTKAL